ncbi:MAG: long-chain fatty acid--CoA ligase [Bacteroidales bacterium]|nr:long-chain fatty acid--CoA ligase [Bacteroidales bacterium]
MEFNSIPEMIRDRAAKYQDRVVLKYRDRHAKDTIMSKTWNQLADETSKLSQVLISESYSKGDNIGIFSSNCPEWIISDLAILDIRAVTVPFFSTASREQCKYIVDETGMKLMFVGDQVQLDIALWLLENTGSLQRIIVFNDVLELKNANCILYKDYLNEPVDKKEQLTKIRQSATVDDLATILYTSGTTGEPKGVMLRHESFIYTFPLHKKRLDLNENDLSMAFLPLSHIFERTWSFYVYYVGGTNFVLDNPKEVIEVLPLVNPTILCVVPRFYEKTYEGILTEKNRWPAYKQKIFDWSINVGYQVSSYRQNSNPLPGLLKLKHTIAEKLVLKKLRSIFGKNIRSTPCSGAKLPLHLLKFFHAAGIFVNYGYGATETTATVSCFKTDSYEFESVGSVMPGVEVKIGENNEILVKGKTVFAGYYKKPEETAESMIDGWYRTGDEGNISALGNLVMTDRIKDLMKTSVGKYVSPQKIETLLGQYSLIEQLVVVGDDRKYVTALIVPEMGKLKDLAEMYKIEYENERELLNNEQIIFHIKERMERLQTSLPNYEKVKHFTLLEEPFTIENNMLTSTLKTKRRVIEKTYAALIDKMY